MDMKLLVLLLIGLAVIHVGEARRKAKKCIGMYTCQKSGSSRKCVCITKDQLCNGTQQCPLEDDEMDCPCPPLPNPLNGKVDLTAGLKPLSVAKYHCNVGYNLVGDPMRMCMANGMWSGAAPTCVAKAEGCDCDNNSPISLVKVPLDMNTDLLTLAEYYSKVVDITYKGVWEFLNPDFQQNHFDLRITIVGANNPVQIRMLTFATSRTPTDTTDPDQCVDVAASTMMPREGTTLAMHIMNLAGNTSNTRLTVHFSSCPDKYVWELICFGKTAAETLAEKTCPVGDVIVWLKVKDTVTSLDELNLDQVARDLAYNTGLKFCQISDIPSWFILQVGDPICPKEVNGNVN